MAVRNLGKTYFVFWTRHGMINDTVTFDKELWDDMKDEFILHYGNFYSKTFFVKWLQSFVYVHRNLGLL